MLSSLFSWSKRKEEEEAEPDIIFGRYSDNNKPVDKVERWNQADNLFKGKKFHDSIAAFFDYLCDEDVKNVSHHHDGQKGHVSF